jgi:hypothetical protein
MTTYREARCHRVRYRATGAAFWRDFYATRVLAFQRAMSARTL